MSLEGTVTISKEEYLNLQKQSICLSLLEGVGVDNWDYYGDSLNPESGDSYDDLVEAELERIASL